MADNVPLPAASGTAAADEAPYSGDTVKFQIMRLVHISGAEGSKVVTEMVGTAGSPGAAVLSIQGVASGTVLPVKAIRATTAVHTNVAASVTSVTLQASNAARIRVDIYNDSASILYVKLGSAASDTSFWQKLDPQGSLMERDWTGIVTGIWVSAVGNARMTELTA